MTEIVSITATDSWVVLKRVFRCFYTRPEVLSIFIVVLRMSQTEWALVEVPVRFQSGLPVGLAADSCLVHKD